jgi:acyl transferase domain-containing protein/NAD(P)-dependent dehydrogenase (short-subunit alcohol dehydrogenase family)/acyl carrier protein
MKATSESGTVERLLVRELSSFLGVSVEQIDLESSFRSLGLDSARSLAFLSRLGRAIGQVLPITLLWECSTIAALAERLTAGSSAPARDRSARRKPTREEPIAIVGLACRLPGASSVEDYWQLLRDGVDAITDLPADRWWLDASANRRIAPAIAISRRAGFVERLDEFDARFFRVSEPEAAHMDPQQGLALELCWEALENAGIAPARIAGTRSGVFLGAIWHDYAELSAAHFGGASPFAGTGAALNIIANRVSYALDLRGPSLVVDTACSSSLVAVHLACQSLQSGESDLALVGGVNVMLSPVTTHMLEQLGALSPDGRSRAFDAEANGYVRGEGGAVVVLKRLSRALSDGDRVWCVVRGSAVNQDGRTNGLTAPNPASQVSVLRDACRAAGIAPSKVHYVEAHGTGTPLGDPIEAHALGEVFGDGRSSERPLRIGSAKTNIGHLEGAAGIAGLVKLALAIDHGELPPSLHFERPNSLIDFDGLKVRVQDALEPWPSAGEAPLAGVSSFGWGGTNCHVVVEGRTLRELPLALAAPSDEELRRHVVEMRERVAGATTVADLATICRSAARELRSGGCRAMFSGSTTAGMLASIDRFLSAAPTAPSNARPRVAFVYSPQGGHWEGMGQRLVEQEPVFRAAIEACDARLTPLLGWSLLGALVAPRTESRWESAHEVQPLIFAVQVALTELWRSWGVTPDAVVGHCMGEIAARYAAGVLDLDDACLVIHHYSRLQARTANETGMAVVGLPASEVERRIESRDLAIAGRNSPNSTNISGPTGLVDDVVVDAQRRGEFAARIRIDVATHSSRMDPILEELREVLAGVRARPATCALVSTVTGTAGEYGVDGTYWAQNLRQPVRFAEAIAELCQAGVSELIELGPHPVVSRFAEECAASCGTDARAHASMHRDDDGVAPIDALGALYRAGVPVRWTAVLGGHDEKLWVAGDAPQSPRYWLLPLSAKTPSALSNACARLHAHLERHVEQTPEDVAFSLATTRTHHEYRLGLTGRDRAELLFALKEASVGAVPRRGAHRQARGGLTAWLLSGQGTQHVGMGRELAATWTVFRQALEEALRAVDTHLDAPLASSADASLRSVSLRDVMWAEAGSALAEQIHQTQYAQPSLFVLEVALAALWKSWGIAPDVLVGHSVGEISAAYVAGVFSLEDAARLVVARGKSMQALPGGAMVSIAASQLAVASVLAAGPRTVSIAAVNGPESTVISGPEPDVLSVASGFASRGLRTKRLQVSHAFHSPMMDAMLDAFRVVAESITYRAADIALVSNVSGCVSRGEQSTAEYWVRHVREAVRFGDCVRSLEALGVQRYVELGPRSTLLGLVPSNLTKDVEDVALVGSLRSERPESESVIDALGALYAAGANVEWKGVFPDGGLRVELPTYPWQRQRYALEVLKAEALKSIGDESGLRGGEPTGHPLLGARVSMPGTDSVYEAVWSRKGEGFLYDHVVSGRVLMPGAGLVEVIRAAGEHRFEGEAVEVRSVVFQSPLVLPEHGGCRVQVVVKEEEGRVEASVYSQASGTSASGEWTLHATGEVHRSSSSSVTLDLAALRTRCSDAVDVAMAYETLASVGLQYGSAFRGMRRLWKGSDEIVGELEVPSGVEEAARYGVHPALLDAALQAALGTRVDESLALPFSIDRLVVHAAGAGQAYVHARMAKKGDATSSADVTLTDAQGRVLVEAIGARFRVVEREGASSVSQAIHRVDWVNAPPSESGRLEGRWLVVGEDETARALVERLAAAGVRCERKEASRIGEALPAEHVVCVWSSRPGEAAPSAALRAASEGLACVQALASASRTTAPPRLVWVTTGAVATDAGPSLDVGPSTVWGLGRTVMREHPELGCKLVDVERGEGAIEQLVGELARRDDEDQVALRSGERRVARLVKAPATQVPEGENYALEATRRGVLDSLGLVAAVRHAPARGEVEIAVRASGLNFRDVMSALGMYPGPAVALGGECAGEVVAVGADVTRFAVGDRVMALASRTFGRFVTVDERQVARIPRGLSFEEASAIPLVFLTAWYALHDLAGLKKGERLLVHAAAGGVGMAAVQIAHDVGAEVLATASPSKWDVVRALGVETLASSRDLSFAQSFRAERGGGVDVVLNSLAREYVDASLSLLSEGGRFVEMGKTDIRDAAQVSAAHPGVRYRAFDLMETDPDRVASMFEAIVSGFERGVLRPLPVRTFAMTEAEAAFRFMAQAKHVGKLVLVPPRELRTDGTVLVTGGLGALGLHAAGWLAKRGVKHLLLLGRRGSQSPGAVEAIAELEASGARVTALAVDVSDRAALASALATIPAELPLRGVIHAAGVLDDGIVAEQTAERFARAMSPKVDGAWHLHELTKESELDVFVMYSSASGTLGNGGQGSYAAANTFLDALATYRQATGRCGQSLAWGLWTDGPGGLGLASGMDAAQHARVARGGIGTVSRSLGEGLLAACLGRSDSFLLTMPLDLAKLRRELAGQVPALWRSLVREGKKAPTRSPSGGWASELSSLPALQRKEAVLTAVNAEVARVLSLPSASSVPVDRPLKELGLDSLMAVELRNALGRRAGATLSMTLAFDHPTPTAIAKHLVESVLSLPSMEKPPTPVLPAVHAADEPIAIVGLGCRYPGGVTDAETFWRLLENGVDAITEVPPERWDADAYYDPTPNTPGKMTTRWGGFLSGLDRFDAGFFGIAPREAVSVEPQQRLLLETSWEALEDAGISPDSLLGSRAGVFIGLSAQQEYSTVASAHPEEGGYRLTGTLASVASGRISYVLGLQGPSMTVDTACSSSLVAMHLACQALRNGECEVALAGGANVTLLPEATARLSDLQALSPTGRCRSFSADADGFVRSEGAGVLVLERLSDARKNGHRVLAVLRATAVNQDGRSNGLTAPHGPSQQAVIREALRRGAVDPASVSYLECHGTGTPLGDPIEVEAAARVLGEGRAADEPLILGSLKSNIGHSEAAAGVGGVIKTVLALQHGEIPKTLHFTSPSPHIPWSELSVKVAAQPIPWPRSAKPRIAGVSSYGISGTNAHVIVEEAPVTEIPELAAATKPSARSSELVVLSAKTPAALSETCARLLAHMSNHPEQTLGEITYSLATTRTHHEERLALTVRSREELVSALSAAALDSSRPGRLPAGKTAWLFTGQGSQRLGMGRELAAAWPAFRDALDEALRAVDAHLDAPSIEAARPSLRSFSLREVMWADEGSALAGEVHQTRYAQPALFVLEVALAALWRSWGLMPDVMGGHSIGEIAAAHVAGVFSLEDAARLVVARGRLMQALPEGGAMVSLAASESAVRMVLEGRSGVSIAAVNGPESTVISGVSAEVLAVAELLSSRGVRTKRLEVSHAFHSALMDPMLDELRAVAESVHYGPATIALVSNLSGGLSRGEQSTAEYWVRHVRDAVRFADGLHALEAYGVRKYVELGPRATLLGLVPSCLAEPSDVALVTSLRSERSESETVLEALGALYASGVNVEWKGVFPEGGRGGSLPTYPWQRQRYWLEPRTTESRAGEPTGHPLLGVRVSMPGVDSVYEAVWSRAEAGWLYDHVVSGRVLMPGAGLAEVIRAAGEHRFEGEAVEVRSVVFQSPLVLPEHGGCRVQVVVKEEEGRVEASVYSHASGASASGEWTLHATGEVHRSSSSSSVTLDLPALRARCSDAVDVATAYETLASVGLQYGSAFRGMRRLWKGSDEIVGELEVPSGVEEAARYGVHPALLDAAFQAALGTSVEEGLALPFSVDRLVVHESGSSGVVVHARTSRKDDGTPSAEVTLTDAQGRVLVEAIGVRFRLVKGVGEGATSVSHAIHCVDWVNAPPSEPGRLEGRWLVVGEDELARGLAERLVAAGVRCERKEASRIGEGLPADHVVCVWSSRPGEAAASVALRVATEALGCVQALASASRTTAPPRLVWVTTGAVATGDAGPSLDVGPSAVWGLGRTVMREHPELGCKLVDVERDEGAVEHLVGELGRQDDEDQVALRSGERRVARLVKAPATQVPEGENYALEATRRGVLDSLGLVAAVRHAPARGEVEIAVRASGLNFRDVMSALGMYPGPAVALGGECAGEVVAVGADVTRFAVGDRVMALASKTFGRYVTVDERQVARIPRGLSMAEASAIPVVFLTAWYALHDLAGLKKGERLLVHAAAGGVGMAAVQIAHDVGAEVLATASPSKWDVVRALGVETLASSRDLSFAQSFRGVDVVLNSLAREFIDASLSLLSEGGRFVEMGKTDIRDAAQVSAAHPGIRYRAFDLSEAGPDRIASMFEAIVSGFERGVLRPLPVRTFAMTEAEAAFRFMAQAKHVGKLVLTLPRELRTNGTVLVTGGLGALGLHAAGWLAKRGVKHLLLLGRRGSRSPGAVEAIAELEASGARVTALAVDVSDRAALASALATIPAELPLRGVIHAAGVLDDGIVAEQTAERFARAMSPKVDGAWHLHELTKESELDVFVMYSSASGTLGNGGQGSYAAANAFLDALATYRQATGRCGQSLAWGLWTDGPGGLGLASGMGAAQHARVARGGIGTVSRSLGAGLLAACLGRSDSFLLTMPLDLAKLRRELAGQVPALWRSLVREGKKAPARSPSGGWASELSSLPALQRKEAVLTAVNAEVARVLSLPSASSVPVDRPLKELGLDSLMAVELRNALGRRAGATLSMTLAFDHPTPTAIAKHLVESVLSLPSTEKPPTPVLPAVHAADEPIAIVGLGCRYPGGVMDAETFWRLLENGVDAITEVPPERWDADAYYDPIPNTPGKMTTRWGGFLSGLDRFDAGFFGIAPREAVRMDPQQRLLLETSWEALEDAGIRPDDLKGSDTGVFVGMCSNEYLELTSSLLEDVDGYVVTGNIGSVASGRISYLLGLQGPSMTVDTACSSSLVAVHLACQSLRSGECNVALAGGSNVTLTPGATVKMSHLQALSPKGRCQTFSSEADGFVRAEGVGVVVLERLSDALRSGHRVLALIRGSAVNQDGRSNGLTAPNGPSQQAVIREALRRGGVEPSSVGYLECHGTGTPLGDPIEVQAASAVLGEGRASDDPVILGSLKSNIGHAEGAAGVGGLIKAVLTLQHGVIPKSLHSSTSLNPSIPWSELPVRVASEPVSWPRRTTPRRAGVSSFGLSGTNAHVVLEEAPELTAAPASAAAPPRSAELVVVSAKTPEAISETCERLREHLESHPSLGLSDVAFSLATSRAHHEHRLALTACTREELSHALEVAATGELPEGATRAEAGANAKVVFVFPGQGSQWLGMGRELLAAEPTFRRAMEECDAAIQAEAGWSVLEELAAAPATSRLDHVEVVQPVLFAMAVSLAALWRSWGVEPSAVVGHSQGEIAAACVSGALTLSQAVRVVCRRSRVVSRMAGAGEMAMVQISAPEAEAALVGYEAEVSVAAKNSRRSTVLSGSPKALGEVLSRLEAKGVFCKRVKVDYASHGPQVDGLRDELLSSLGEVTAAAPRIRMVSTVTRAPVTAGELDARYWADNLRKPVELAEVVEGLLADGHALLLEVSAHPVLLPALEDLRSERGAVVGSLYRDKPERLTLLQALGALHAHGAPVEFQRVFPAGRVRVELPTYAWQRERYWFESRGAGVRSGEATGHALLGVRVPVAGLSGSAVYESALSRSEAGWLYEHEVGGRPLMPGAALVELLRAAGEDYVGGEAVEVRSVAFESPLVLSDRGGRVQVVVKEEEERLEATVYSRRPEDREWRRHASGALHRVSVADVPVAESYDALRARCTEGDDVAATYEGFASVGLTYGPVFRGLRALWRGVGEAVGEVSLPEEVEVEGYGIHPALLDAAFHAIAGVSPEGEEGKAWLPFSMERFVVHASGARTARVHVRRGSSVGSAAGVDLRVVDVEGRVVAEVIGLQTRAGLATASSGQESSATSDALYVVKWSASVPSSSPGSLGGRWAVVGPVGDALAEGVAGRLSSMGVEAVERLEVSGLAAGAEGAEHVVCVWGGSASETDAESALRVAREGLSVVQALARRAGTDGTSRRLWWVTREAVSTCLEEGAKAALAPLWGLGRTVMAEHPELGCRLVDVDAETDAESLKRAVDAIVRELGQGDDENQVAWRDGERRVARLEHAPREAVLDAESYRLEIGAKGSLDQLKLVGTERRKPGAGEVEIEVRATGLNFRDVVSALGMEATAGFEGSLEAPLGGECSGVVVAVGTGVTRFGVGDEVMALASGSFSRFVTTDARVVARMPDGLSYAQAAGIPVAFLTAWYGLFDLGGLKAGERVLIHAAAGGVGMAAVQLAQRIGAEVYGTASSGKWEAVKAQGVAHVASSRDLGFASSLREASGGRGVDVVLNSLSGEFVDESLSLLSRGGRFIEMGKTDVRDASAMATKYPGTSYRAFDLMEAGPARLGEMLASVAEALAKGDLRPLPIETFTVTEAERAFRWMAQARHVGKIVLTAARRLRTDGAVLITGGLGVLGLHAARMLVEGGVKHLVLVGRRGVETPGAAEAIASLKEAGAEVMVASVDVTDRAGLAALLEGLPSSVPLRGVVHTAGALDDGVLSEQTPERFARVLAPKVLGSWHLHELTKDKELDVFVLYSSASGTLGNGGQGPYAAANVFMDALASSRRAAGLAGQSIAWGLWVDESQRAAGLAAHLGDAHAGSTSSWMGAITPALGARLLRSLLGREESEIAAVPVKLAALSKAFGDSVPALWRSLVTKRPRRATAGTWARELSLLPPEQREEAIVAAVRAEVARVLSMPSASSVAVDRPLKELGLDSLMAVELRNALGRRVGKTFPATLVFDHPTPLAIAKHVSRTLSIEEPVRGSTNLLEELERLKVVVSRTDSSDPARASFLKAMSSLLKEWTRQTTSSPATSELAQALTDADDDTLFRLIDEEVIGGGR